VNAPCEAASAPRARSELRLANAGAAYEWLRDTAGTGELADLCHRNGRELRVEDGRHRMTSEQLAALIQTRYRVLDGRGRPRLFPLAVARLVIASPGSLPHVRDQFEDVA